MTMTRRIAATCISLTLVVSLLVALAIALSAAPSQAQEATCPAGTTLSEDGTACLSSAVDDNVTTTTSCTQGVLSDDGQFCIVPRIDTPAAAPASTNTTTVPIPAFTG